MHPANQEFDRKIRERMAHFTPDVSAGLWAKIEAGLPDGTHGAAAQLAGPRRKPSRWWWAAAAVLAVSLLSYWFTRPVDVIYLQGKTTTPEAVSPPQTTGRDNTAQPAMETGDTTPGPVRTAQEIPQETAPVRAMPATAEPVREAPPAALAVRQPPVVIETASVAPVVPDERAVADTVAIRLAEVPEVQPPVVPYDTATEMLASTAPSKPFGVSRLLNFVIGTVDRREEKAVTFSSDSEGSLKVEFNLAGNRSRK